MDSLTNSILSAIDIVVDTTYNEIYEDIILFDNQG